MKHAITLSIINGTWMAKNTDPKIRAAFGTDTISTAFSAKTPADAVLLEIDRLNPDYIVSLEGEVPPDPEEMNDKRAGWADEALAAFKAATRQTDDKEALRDLLCDLGHLSDRLGVPAKESFRMAMANYAEETSNDET